MLNVRRRTDPQYAALPERRRPWLVDFRAPDGARVRFTLPAELSRRDAESVGRARWIELHNPPPEPPPAAPAWVDVASRYWLERGRHLRSARTVKIRLEALTNAIGDETPVDQIDVGALADRLDEDLEEPRGRPRTTRAGVNRTLDVWRAAMRHAGRWDLELSRRLAGVKRPEVDSGDRSLSAAEIARLHAHAPDHLRLFIEIALRTGLRSGAILSLRWEDIDFDRGVIRAWSKGRAAGGKATPVPLTHGLRAVLGPQRCDRGPVIRYQGEPVRSVRSAWTTARDAAGLPQARIHDLRHTFASRLAAAGRYDLVPRALAHGGGQTVSDRYIGGWIEILRAALEEIERS